MKKICSFFGHRNIFGNIEQTLIAHIRFAIEVRQVKVFYIGGYGAFDDFASKAMRDIKVQYNDVEVYLILAYFPTRPIVLSAHYDGSLFFEGMETVHKKGAITKRNRLMVEKSDMIICYINHDHGGAFTATKEAQRQKKVIFNCADNQFFSTNK